MSPVPWPFGTRAAFALARSCTEIVIGVNPVEPEPLPFPAESLGAIQIPNGVLVQSMFAQHEAGPTLWVASWVALHKSQRVKAAGNRSFVM